MEKWHIFIRRDDKLIFRSNLLYYVLITEDCNLEKKKLIWATWCFTHLISAQDFDFQFFSEFRATQYQNHQLTQGQSLTRSGAGVQSLFLFPTISISTVLTDQMVANRRFKPASQMAFYTFSPSLKFCTISHQLRPYNPTHETTRV